MAKRILALDWDQDQLHLVVASVGGGTVRFTRALVVDEAGTPGTTPPEKLGALLRDRLKEHNIAAAPVVACLGRDRLIVKEVHYPAVPAHEEAGVVRFQAIKELTDSAADMAIDYTPLPPHNGEKRAQVLVVRRDLIAAYQSICQAAGLKLSALVPRGHAMAAGFRALVESRTDIPRPEPADAAVAIIAIGEKWAEFAIVQGQTLLQARTLTLGPALAGEIRRNLAVHAGHSSHSPVRAIYLALSGEQAALRQKLVESLDVPVHPFDPFAGAEGQQLPSSGRGTFVGAVGLLRILASAREFPVNFACIKEVRPPKDPNQRLYLLVACLLLVLFGVGFIVASGTIDRKKKELSRYDDEIADLDKELKQQREKRQRMQALFDWETVYWPGELMDLSRAMPKIERNQRVTKLDAAPDRLTSSVAGGAAQKQAGPPSIDDLNTKPAARVQLEILAPGDAPLNELTTKLREAGNDKHGSYLQPEPQVLKQSKYTKDIRIRKRPPTEFQGGMTVADELAPGPRVPQRQQGHPWRIDE